jgi:hypothetical protein
MRKGSQAFGEKPAVVNKTQSTIITVQLTTVRMYGPLFLGHEARRSMQLELGEITKRVRAFGQIGDDLMNPRLRTLEDVDIRLRWHNDGFAIEELFYDDKWYRLEEPT